MAPPTYGSAWPFDTRGGSGSGGFANPISYGTPGLGGSGGGGTIVLSADGPLDVRGRVSARGAGIASAGSILLQSTVALRIQGSVDAGGPSWFWEGGSGWIRLDAHGDPPAVVGVTPNPMVVVLPRFGDVPTPSIGSLWRIRLDAWPGDVVAVWLSSRQASLPFPPFGTLRLDPTAGLFLAGETPMAASMTGLEASGTLTVPVPNVPGLRGVTLHAQGLNVITAAANPRFTELSTVTIQ